MLRWNITQTLCLAFDKLQWNSILENHYPSSMIEYSYDINEIWQNIFGINWSSMEIKVFILKGIILSEGGEVHIK